MDVLHTYVYHMWNEWARGFVPDAVTPWFVREDWLKDEDIYQEFIKRIGCTGCLFLAKDGCRLKSKQEFQKVVVPCKDPDL